MIFCAFVWDLAQQNPTPDLGPLRCSSIYRVIIMGTGPQYNRLQSTQMFYSLVILFITRLLIAAAVIREESEH